MPKRLDRRLEEVAKAVCGYCPLQMPLKLTLGVRDTVAGRRLGALEEGGGGYSPPPSNASLGRPAYLCDVAAVLCAVRDVYRGISGVHTPVQWPEHARPRLQPSSQTRPSPNHATHRRAGQQGSDVAFLRDLTCVSNARRQKMQEVAVSRGCGHFWQILPAGEIGEVVGAHPMVHAAANVDAQTE